MRYTAELRTYIKGDIQDEYSAWDSFDSFNAEDEEDDSFYDATYYIVEAVESAAEIADLMARGDIEDFQIRVIDDNGKEISIKWASEMYPSLYQSKRD